MYRANPPAAHDDGMPVNFADDLLNTASISSTSLSAKGSKEGINERAAATDAGFKFASATTWGEVVNGRNPRTRNKYTLYSSIEKMISTPPTGPSKRKAAPDNCAALLSGWDRLPRRARGRIRGCAVP